MRHIKILIVKNGVCRTFISRIIQSINKEAEFEIIYSSQIKNTPCNFDCVIILGGTMSTMDTNSIYSENLHNLLDYIKACDINCIPVLGICLGCQLIAKYIGFNIVKADKPICGFKNINVIKEDDPLCKCIQKHKYMYISLHEDVIERRDSYNEFVLATYNEYPYYIRKNKLCGFQFHPDIVEENVKRMATCFGMKEECKLSIKNYFIENKENIFEASQDIFREWFKLNNLT